MWSKRKKQVLREVRQLLPAFYDTVVTNKGTARRGWQDRYLPLPLDFLNIKYFKKKREYIKINTVIIIKILYFSIVSILTQSAEAVLNELNVSL